MNQKKVIPTWLNILCLILIIGCIAWTIFCMCNSVAPDIGTGNEDPAASQATSQMVSGYILLFGKFKLIEISSILASIVALAYCLLGYNKKASVFFKAFLYLFALYTFIEAIGSINFITQIANTIKFGLLCALSLSINLGKIRSYIYAGLYIVLSTVGNIVFAIQVGSLGNCISELVLMMILGIMIYAKYQDKAARGTN